MARYHIINDHNISPCSDDDCARHHVNVYTDDELAARDNANYDAGYEHARNAATYRAPTYSAEHAANVGWPAIDAYLADHWASDGGVHSVARGPHPANRSGSHPAGPSFMTWARWEEQFAGGPGTDMSSGSYAERIGSGIGGGWRWTALASLVLWAGVAALAWTLMA